MINNKFMETNVNFYCPKCFGNINVENQVIFKVKAKDGSEGLVILTGSLNDYHSIGGSAIKKVEGDFYEFYCPLCGESLAAHDIDKNLVRIFMTDKENNKFEILFSSIFGEKCTYKIKEGHIEYFGKHAQEYLRQIEKYREFYDRY